MTPNDGMAATEEPRTESETAATADSDLEVLNDVMAQLREFAVTSQASRFGFVWNPNYRDLHELLEQLGNQLPLSIDSANKVLHNKGLIISQARMEADTMKEESRCKAEELLRKAKAEAEDVRTRAQEFEASTTERVNRSSVETAQRAAAEAARVRDAALDDAATMRTQADEGARRTVQQALLEQERLVSESEVLAQATQRANELLRRAEEQSAAIRAEAHQWAGQVLDGVINGLEGARQVATQARTAMAERV